jgi:AGZA family xanthine/uracil permease-like MFS transporter
MVGGGIMFEDRGTIYPITAGALIIVGFFMMKGVKEISWDDIADAFPAFITIVGIPLTYNISYGIGFGFISYTLIKLATGKAKQIHPLMYFISAAFVVAFLDAAGVFTALFG